MPPQDSSVYGSYNETTLEVDIVTQTEYVAEYQYKKRFGSVLSNKV